MPREPSSRDTRSCGTSHNHGGHESYHQDAAEFDPNECDDHADDHAGGGEPANTLV
jgi:hypothetical protein